MYIFFFLQLYIIFTNLNKALNYFQPKNYISLLIRNFHWTFWWSLAILSRLILDFPQNFYLFPSFSQKTFDKYLLQLFARISFILVSFESSSFFFFSLLFCPIKIYSRLYICWGKKGKRFLTTPLHMPSDKSWRLRHADTCAFFQRFFLPSFVIYFKRLQGEKVV